MSLEASAENELEPTEERPQQFGLRGFFILLSVVAAVLAFATPWVRAIPEENWGTVAIGLSIQLTGWIAATVWMTAIRLKVLRGAGRRLGYGYWHGQSGPAITTTFVTLALVGIVAIELLPAFELIWAAVTFHVSRTWELFDWVMMMLPAFWGAMGGAAFCAFLRGRNLGRTEIFENGVYLTELRYWQNLRVRSSEHYTVALILTAFPRPKDASGIVCTLYIAEPLRTYLLEHHGGQEAADS